MSGEDLPGVRALYEAFPFPTRDPDTEGGALPLSRVDILAKVNHFAFGGRRDFTKPIRVLVAGGGTGDSAIFLAAQLRDAPAEIFTLDFSRASLDIARKRAAKRGLDGRIKWVEASLLDVSTLGLGRFDYISCLGVLHHLADPAAGLSALTSVLSEGGAMGLMLYGRYGRQDVYAVQDLARRINCDAPTLRGQLDNLKQALRALSPSHPLARGRTRAQFDALIADDANLADTFLHPQDRAYDVSEVYALARGAGLTITSFTNFGRRLALEYDPQIYLGDAPLAADVAQRAAQERCAIAELLHGHMFTHAFYVRRDDQAPASFLDPDMVPLFASAAGAEAGQELARTGIARLKLSSRIVHEIRLSPAARACLALADGALTMSQIWAAAAAQLAQGDAEIARTAAPELDRLAQCNWLFLRHKDVPAPPALAYGFPGDAARLEQ